MLLVQIVAGLLDPATALMCLIGGIAARSRVQAFGVALASFLLWAFAMLSLDVAFAPGLVLLVAKVAGCIAWAFLGYGVRVAWRDRRKAVRER